MRANSLTVAELCILINGLVLRQYNSFGFERWVGRMHGSDILHSRYEIQCVVKHKHSVNDNERTNQPTNYHNKKRHDLWNFCCHSPLLQSFRTQTFARTKCLSCSFPISMRNHAKFPLTYHLHHFSSSQSVRMNRLIVQRSWCRSHKCKSQANTNANGTKYKRLMSINGIKACLFPWC